MEEPKVKTEQKEAQKEAQKLSVKEMASLLQGRTGALLAEGTAVKLFPGAKDVPSDNDEKSKEVLQRKLKITRSKDDVNTAYTYLRKLQLIKEMLEGDGDIKSLRKKAMERRDLVADTFRQNMSTVFSKQRDLEKTFREIDTFFYEAAISPGEKVDYVTFINASPNKHFQEITDPEEGIATHFADKNNFDLRMLTGLMVMPEWPGSEAKALKYAEIAQQFMAHLFVGFPDMELKEALEKFEVGEEFAELKSQDEVKQHMSVVGNPLRMRRKNQFEEELGDFYINPASILAGKIYKGDVTEGMHIAQANRPHKVAIPTPDDSPLEMKWNVRGAREMKFNKALIPLSYFEGIVFWGVDTLYAASGQGDEGMDQYTVKRCDEYIAKVVLHFLNSQIFVPNERKSRDKIRSSISTFLMDNTGEGKMLEFGKVEAVDIAKNSDGTLNNQALDIRINVKYKNAVRHMNLFLLSDENDNWVDGNG